MGIIQCSSNCKYQIDGYCTLDKCGTVNSINADCPYYVKTLFNVGNRLSQRIDTDEFK